MMPHCSMCSSGYDRRLPGSIRLAQPQPRIGGRNYYNCAPEDWRFAFANFRRTCDFRPSELGDYTHFNMLWTIVGLAITTVVSIEGTVNSNRSKQLKIALQALALVGFGVAIIAASNESADKKKAQDHEQIVTEKLDAANVQLRDQSALLKLVTITVGDLGVLNRLSGGQKYYVRIAADTSKARLEGYLRDIDKKFGGAKSSGLVSIRDPRPGSALYTLIFGSGLDVAAAEVFQRLANSHHFPPDSQIAEIEPEPGP
jgi:hypothetical protein